MCTGRWSGVEEVVDQGPTDGVGLPRQLDAAVLQLLHPLLQVSLLLHQGGESVL